MIDELAIASEEKQDHFVLERNQEKKYLDFVEIDSPVSLNSAVKEKSRKMVLCGDKATLMQFLKKIANFKSLTHLVIKTADFSLIWQDDVKKTIKNGLKYLRIECNIIEDPKILVENLYFYSSLEVLEIIAQEYKESYFNSRDGNNSLLQNYLEVQPFINKKCYEILELNKKVAELLSNILPALKKKLIKLDISEENLSKDLNSQQIHFVLCQDNTFKIIQKLAEEWDVKNIVSNNNVRRFNIVKSFLPKFDVNELFPIFENEFARLVDIAVDGQAVEMVKVLNSLGANLTRFYKDSDNIPVFDSHSTCELSNFPFFKAIRGNNERLKNFFLRHEEALYDGLAWLIYKNDSFLFEEIIKEANVDVKKNISGGLFSNFTLLQLMIYYQRTELSIKWIENSTSKKCTMLGNQFYPERKFFEYSGWSVFSAVIYEGQYNILVALSQKVSIQKINLENNSRYKIIELLLHGACERKNKLKDYRKCFNFLIKIDRENFISSYSTEKNGLPLLHFSIYNQIFSVIQDHVHLFEKNLLDKVDIKEKGELDAFQLAATIFKFNKENKEIEDTIKTLCTLYKHEKHLDSAIEPLKFLEDLNLFQYSILSKNVVLFSHFIDWEEYPVNLLFPENHPKYPGWLTIHVVMLNVLAYDPFMPYPFEFLYKLLTRKNLDITRPFIEEGIPHHLVQHYPSSAIFFLGNPIKDASSNGIGIFNLLDSFLSLVKPLTDKNLKIDILNQALFFAILHHDMPTSHDHTEQIKTLLVNGADPYKCFGIEGERSIDLAEKKGLFHLFPQLKESARTFFFNKNLIFTENARDSELSELFRRRLRIKQDRSSVISLVRNKESSKPEHAFIILEEIIRGRSVVHFIDFIKDIKRTDHQGDIRHEKFEGRIVESLIFNCKKRMMEINSLDHLICQSWQITKDESIEFLKSIELDKDKEIDYAFLGNRSVFSCANGKKIHSCYTWAREKLQTINSEINKALKPTFEEWIGTLPSLKDQPLYQNRYLLFSSYAVVGALSFLSLAPSIYYYTSGNMSFKS